MTDIIKVFRGRRGQKGIDGEDGTGVSDIRESILDNPVDSLLFSNNLSNNSSLNWARAGEALITDRYNNPKWVSGDDITNFIKYSNDFTNWDDLFNRWSIVSTGNPDPEGGNNATIMKLDATTVAGDIVLSGLASGMTIAIYHTLSFWFKIVSGTITGVDIAFGGDTFKIDPAKITNSFVRVSIPVELNASGAIVDINVIGTIGSQFSIFKTQHENGSVVHDPIDTTTIPVTVPNPLTPARSNDLGYLIEDQKQNLILNGENLNRSNWSVSGGTVTSYQSKGAFGDLFQNIQVNWITTPSLTVSSTGTFTEGDTYTVSAYIYAIGNITSLTATVSGGDPVSFGELSTEGFTRLSVEAVAGPSGDLVFSAISPDLSGQLILTAVNATQGSLSSYIRTGGALIARPEDDVNLTYSIASPSDNWTVSFGHSGIDNTSDIKYIFNNGLSSGGEFSCWFESDNLKINAGGVTKVFSTVLDSTNLTLVYDGSKIDLYKNGLFYMTTNIIISIDAISTVLYIGSDETNGNSINAFLSKLYFYDSALTSDEVRYLAGV